MEDPNDYGAIRRVGKFGLFTRILLSSMPSRDGYWWSILYRFFPRHEPSLKLARYS